MKKLIFFMIFLIFTRIGMSFGISAAPIGIGNFFLGAPSITESNLNQVLGLLVGSDGQPGQSGVSGANGLNGINGLPGVSGTQGLPGTQGVKGDPGAPGTSGAPGVAGVAGVAGKDGGIGSVGLGGGEVSIGTCDASVNISVTQTFSATGFKLATVKVSNIDATSCAGFDATIHLLNGATPYSCTLPIAIADFLVFNLPAGCGTNPPTDILMDALVNKIGLEFTKPV